MLLDVVRLVCLVTVGILIIFWSKINLNLSAAQKYIAGGLFIVYGVVRFTLSYKRTIDE